MKHECDRVVKPWIMWVDLSGNQDQLQLLVVHNFNPIWPSTTIYMQPVVLECEYRCAFKNVPHWKQCSNSQHSHTDIYLGPYHVHAHGLSSSKLQCRNLFMCVFSWAGLGLHRQTENWLSALHNIYVALDVIPRWQGNLCIYNYIYLLIFICLLSPSLFRTVRLQTVSPLGCGSIHFICCNGKY